MRHLARLTLVLLLAVPACGKKAPPPDEEEEVEVPAPDPSAARTRLLTALKKQRSREQLEAPDALAKLAATDPAVVPALVELLADKGTAGGGKAGTAAVTSTREGAARALLQCGPDGEKALAASAAALKPGLTDPSAAVREHTARTAGVIGRPAAGLATDVLRLCGDPDPNVRAAAFDALPALGPPDAAVAAKLLRHPEPDVRRLAAQVVATVRTVPAEAVAPLAEALADPDAQVASAAADALAAAGPAAAPAVPALVRAIERAAAAEKFDPRDPERGRFLRAAVGYWRALAGVGEPAVGPIAKLLAHKNPLVRLLAARSLGEIGPPAKPAAAPLKAAFADEFGPVRIEAACALCRIGADETEAVELLKGMMEMPGDRAAGYAIEAVARAGRSAESLVPLALAKLTSASPDARFAAAELAGLLPPDKAVKAVPGLLKLLADDEELIRARAAAVLDALGPAAAPAAPEVAATLGAETDPGVRETLVDVLAAMGPGAKPAAPVLAKLLADDSAPTRLRLKILPALATADPASAAVAEAVQKAASDPDEFVRGAAALALGKLDPLPAAGLSALSAMAKTDRAHRNRLKALQALAAAGPRAKPARDDLEKLTASPNPDLALWAKVVRATAGGEPGRAAADVRAALTHRNGNLRAAGVEAIPLLGPPDPTDLPALTKLLKDPVPGVRAGAAAAVGRYGERAKEAVPVLAEMLADRDPDVREAAAAALGSMGKAALPAVRPLQAAAQEASGGKAARTALAKLGVKVEPRPDRDRRRE